MLLMLVGPPGSGKSTVCQKIVQNSARPWTRVCQVCFILLKQSFFSSRSFVRNSCFWTKDDGQIVLQIVETQDGGGVMEGV